MIAPVFHINVLSGNFQVTNLDSQHLFPSQADLLSQGFLESDQSWIICAPTGAGKTRMAEWALQSAIDKGFRSAYIAPLKAIVDERITDWSTRFPEWKIGLFTGETTRGKRQQAPHDENVLLFTPEKLSAYLHNWKKHLAWLAELDVIVIDEIHLLGDAHRGGNLEAMIGRLQRINPFVRFVGLSGTLSNADEIAQWLQARSFVSDWRPVPVTNTIRRFKRVTDKPAILLDEIQATIEQGGQSLVFVNSRRRSESLVKHLREQGIHADFNHAGLSREDRQKSQGAMRDGGIQVMVSTSTLEMGVNFPARKVIIYDAYGFDGERFSPLSIQRYRQYAGRAGRAGYDDTGESVLLLPNWHRDGEHYLTDEPEPVRSALFDTQNLLREVLTEVCGRLSISADHLEVNFADRTLWRKQDGRKSLSLHVQHLITAGLLKEREKNDRVYLSPSPVGRIAAQMSLSPQTVTLLSDFHKTYPEPTEFDILLIACLCQETTPKLGFNFEQIDDIGDIVLGVPSTLLDLKPDWFLQPGRGLNEKKLLSAIKCASIINQHTDGKSIDSLAETFDAYPADIKLLKTHLGWVLDSAERIFGVLTQSSPDEKDENAASHPPHSELTASLKKMIEYGIPRHALGLTSVPGIGPVRAQALAAEGIFNSADLIQSDSSRLSLILKLRPSTIECIKENAADVEEEPAIEPGKPAPKSNTSNPKSMPSSWPTDLDPYRLRRALELNVEHASAEALRISGGSEPHRVLIIEDSFRRRTYECDCQDFAKGTVNCKHILRARLEHNDSTLLELLAQWRDLKPSILRYSLAELWIHSGRIFDAYNGREVDYTGNRFLKKIHKKRIAR